MRKRGALALTIIAGAAVFLVVLALYLPASWFASALPPQLRCNELGGSIWHGECLGLQYQGAALGDATWNLAPTSALSGRLAGDLDLRGSALTARADLDTNFSGRRRIPQCGAARGPGSRAAAATAGPATRHVHRQSRTTRARAWAGAARGHGRRRIARSAAGRRAAHGSRLIPGDLRRQTGAGRRAGRKAARPGWPLHRGWHAAADGAERLPGAGLHHGPHRRSRAPGARDHARRHARCVGPQYLLFRRFLTRISTSRQALSSGKYRPARTGSGPSSRARCA